MPAKIKITWTSDTSMGMMGSFTASGRTISVVTHRSRFNRNDGRKGYVHRMVFLTRDGGVATTVREVYLYEKIKTSVADEAARFVAETT